ncbi:hypothetical protein [Ruicaihuangia caeni]|uniref:hypothetical protein n=1 Tax=Ruicaihuangia caeni TaxID=3042517 RepID=UPI00338D53CA
MSPIQEPSPANPAASALALEFCGERHQLDPGAEFTIGREGDLVIDENPYLHRRFLAIGYEFGMWWIANVGSLLSATVTDGTGQVQAWLAPGARLPIVFETMHVMFSAGSTTYDFTLHSDGDHFNTSAITLNSAGSTTMMPVTLTTSQRMLVVALAEHVLRQGVPGRGEIPSSADAAARLGWSMTTFNRKLDNVCEKLDKIGVHGLRGGRGRLATNRRARLVEYAVASRLVGPDDLELLDASETAPPASPALG